MVTISRQRLEAVPRATVRLEVVKRATTSGDEGTQRPELIPFGYARYNSKLLVSSWARAHVAWMFKKDSLGQVRTCVCI